MEQHQNYVHSSQREINLCSKILRPIQFSSLYFKLHIAKIVYVPTSLLSFKENLSDFFPWDLPVVKISPEWVTAPEQGKSSGRIATVSLWTGMFRDGALGQITKQMHKLQRS